MNGLNISVKLSTGKYSNTRQEIVKDIVFWQEGKYIFM